MALIDNKHISLKSLLQENVLKSLNINVVTLGQK